MAARFNIEDKRVYKIIDKCKQRIMRALRDEPQLTAGRRLIRVRTRRVREYIKGREHLPDCNGGRYIDYYVFYEEYK